MSRNWGSRSVYRLDSMSKDACQRLLFEINKLVQKGEIWLIQEEVSQPSGEFVSEDIQKIIDDKMHVEISVFYGNNCVIGVKIMARQHFKVHGNAGTWVGLGI